MSAVELPDVNLFNNKYRFDYIQINQVLVKVRKMIMKNIEN